MRKFEIYRRVLPGLGPIIFRNIFILVNVVIFFVVVLLFIFGSKEAALFLGIVFFLNTLIAIVQDIHARVLLEKLQMLTALKVTLLNKDNTTISVFAEEIKKGDFIQMKLGDQAPCDGVLISVDNLEISEALITGESDSFSRKEGDKMMAGSIVTSGFAVMEARGFYHESRLARIAGDVKKYAANPSSIQTATNKVIKYSGYILIFVLVFVFTRGMIVHATRLEMINNAGALASTIIPQGLVVAITLLFAIGAADYSRRNVLFQEINATEKLGRVKNLCIDKTGTLTDNVLMVENMLVAQGLNEEEVKNLTYACVLGLSDSSQTIVAVKKYLEKNDKKDLVKKEIIKSLLFSSWRRYGAVIIRDGDEAQNILIGSPDIFLPRISDITKRQWLENVLKENAQNGKRVLCVARGKGDDLPKDLEDKELSILAIFIFHNTLREGIVNAIKFFQNRGVQIRVLSGDSLQTVRAVAKSVGINDAENVVSGRQLSEWSDSEFKTQANKYSIFAEVLPEHKVKLVEVFKKDGFTAMVGDGVNDALAMKKADLGIAMFDGAPVTRQLADVILTTNSFSDLPGAVKLADHFIRSIEINSGIYINMSLFGLLFFVILSIFGYPYPLTPLNITFINYFTVGFSSLLVSYWALRPSGRVLPANDKSFLERILPLVFVAAIFEAIGAALVFMLSPNYLKIAPSNTMVVFSFILFGFLFLLFAARVYCVSLTKKEKYQLFYLGVFQVVLIYLILRIPFLVRFFNITLPFPSLVALGNATVIVLGFGLVQYFVIKKLFFK